VPLRRRGICGVLAQAPQDYNPRTPHFWGRTTEAVSYAEDTLSDKV
jgi:hypothetical protein